jgi:hypothetical protein
MFSLEWGRLYYHRLNILPDLTMSSTKYVLLETETVYPSQTSALTLDLVLYSSIDWNSDNEWAAGEGIISAEVNTTVPMTVYLSR